MIKVLHTADLHLDSPFSSEGQNKEEKKELLLSSFRRMMDYCRKEKIDLLLIAGDLFDSPRPDDSVVTRVISAFSEFEGMIYITPGNHDPYIEGSVYKKHSFPSNVNIFDKEAPQIKKLKIRNMTAEICGAAFTSYIKEGLDQSAFPSFSENCIKLLLLHCDLYSKESTYLPLSRDTLKAISPHYSALGHIHKRSMPEKAGDGLFCYPGCIMGRDFGETGTKGGYRLDFQESLPVHSPTISFIPFGCETYITTQLNTEEAYSAEELLSKIDTSSLDRSCNLRLTLTGECSFDTEEGAALIINALKDKVNHIEITDNTEECLDISLLEKDKTVLGEFYRLITSEEEQNPITSLALKLGIKALMTGKLDSKKRGQK